MTFWIGFPNDDFKSILNVTMLIQFSLPLLFFLVVGLCSINSWTQYQSICWCTRCNFKLIWGFCELINLYDSWLSCKFLQNVKELQWFFLFDATRWSSMWNTYMHGNHHWFHIPKWSSLLCLLCICFHFVLWVILCAYVMVDLQQPTHVHATMIAKTCVRWQLCIHAHTFLPQHMLCNMCMLQWLQQTYVCRWLLHTIAFTWFLL
jgi:hypothetical protein